jgi:hypothetical protein
MSGSAETQATLEPTEAAPSGAAIDLAALPRQRLEAMLAAGEDILECARVLRKAGLNVVGEVLKGQGTFFQMKHYPEGDVFDRETHSQYYYHAHRPGEHGHFHTFLRQPGMPAGVKPVCHPSASKWPSGEEALAHLVAISMDRYGYPTGLFTTNRWVTAETWYAGSDVTAMLDRFAIDHAYPSWPTNRWLTAMVRLFHPQIVTLIEERDRRIGEWMEEHPDRDVFEDRDLEVLSEVVIDVEAQIESVRRALG